VPRLKKVTLAPAPPIQDAPVTVALSVRKAALAVGVSTSFLYTQMTAGRLKYVKAGRRRLIPVADLNAFLTSLSTEA
jgi:excisionase family DNA binding protein